MGKCQKNGVFIRLSISVWLVSATFFAGCIGSSRRDPDRPLEFKGPPLTQESFLEDPSKGTSNDLLEDTNKATAETTVIPWWTSFNDPQLNFFVELALEKNLTIQEAWANIDQAESRLKQANAGFFPTVDGRVNVQKRWITPQDESIRNRGDDSTVGGAINWELDVWGRLRSAKVAAIQDLESMVQGWRAARLDLTSSVAITYFSIQEQRLQLELNRSQFKSNEMLLDLTRLRFAQGQTSIVDVLQQKDQLAATQVNEPGFEARLKELQYAMDALLSMPMGYTQTKIESLDSLPEPPELPKTGHPTELLLQRPDLLAMEAQARAMNARVAQAIADRFPRLNLGASLTGVGDPTLNSMIATIFGNITGPLIDGGLRRAEVQRRKSQLEGMLLRYSQAFLVALRDVESALINVRQQQERIRRLESRLANAQRLLSESQNRYSQGLTDYLPALTAVVTEQNLRRQWLTSQRDVLALYVGLCSSLGGPVPPPALPSEDEDEAAAEAGSDNSK
jgi:NodT family efflux transporter outer membrane factor (OMF) lipoprotein